MRRLCPAVICVLLVFWVCSTAPAQVQPPVLRVYCSAATEQSLDLLSLDPATGRLSKNYRLATPGEPGALTFSPDGRFLFASMRSTGRLCSFRIDPASGRPDPISVIEAGADPAQISVDHSGRYLLTAYYVAAKVTVHAIGRDGTLSEQPVQTIETAKNAHAIVPDLQNRFVYAPHTGPNLIFQFSFDAKSGTLTPLSPDRLQRPQQTGPRHLVWHPTEPLAFINNEQGSSVTVYEKLPSGQLQPGHSETTLPPGFTGANSTAEIQIHPTGRFLYVANRGHDSIAVIRVEDSGRRLTFVGCEPTEPTPRSFHIESTGRYLLAAGESSGRLQVFEIHPDTGRLKSVSIESIGPRLWWVLTAPVLTSARP
ncbi:MAG: 6-phosphogluconolactonase [Planctomycetota bacterium]|jgi:6-phosphogluconolactonase